MKKYRMQLIFGIPILTFAITCIILDSLSIMNVGNFGYAWFGSIITTFLVYFFRKKPPEEPVETPT